jgi:ParB family chromosome partitioning protein
MLLGDWITGSGGVAEVTDKATGEVLAHVAVASAEDCASGIVLARQHGIKKAKDGDSIEKLFVAFLRRADESTLSRILVESVVLLTAMRNNPAKVLQDAAALYKVDIDAITLKVKQEFAAKDKRGRANPSATAKSSAKKAPNSRKAA